MSRLDTLLIPLSFVVLLVLHLVLLVAVDLIVVDILAVDLLVVNFQERKRHININKIFR